MSNSRCISIPHPTTTAAKIAAVASHHPAHATSLGMQILMEEKLRLRMKRKGGAPISALGWILNEWLKILESRHTDKTYLARLHKIVKELLADPTREPIAAASVYDANTAIPDSDLDSIIAQIPHPIAAAGAILGEDEEDQDQTEMARTEEKEAMDTVRQKYEADQAAGIMHQNFLTDDILAAVRQNRKK